MRIRKIRGHEHSQVGVHEYRKEYGDSSNKDVLVSYSTAVVAINYDTHYVTVCGLYSRTTIKHISWFMREKGMNYFIAKKCWKEDLFYDFVKQKYYSIDFYDKMNVSYS